MRNAGWILVLLTVLWAVDAALGLGVFWAHDLRHHHVPWRVWASAEWLQGRPPLWNADIGNGFPLAADGQTGAFYVPTMVLFALLPKGLAINAAILGHVAWAGEGTRRLMHRLGVVGPGAMLAAVAFAFSGFMTTHAGYLGMQNTAAWLPWLVLSIASGRWASMGLCAAMVMVAGHPQMAIIIMFGASFVAVWRGQLRLFMAAGLLGALAAGPQIFATAELIQHSMRQGGVTEDFASVGVLPIQEMLNGVLPSFFGFDRPADIAQSYFHRGSGYWGSGANHWDMAFYLGIPVVVLACCGLRQNRFWVGLAVGSILLMVGSPLWTLLRQVPVFDSMRFPARFSVLLTLSVAVLAGHGMQRLLAKDNLVPMARTVSILSVLGLLAMAVAQAVVRSVEGGLRDSLMQRYSSRPVGTDGGPLESALSSAHGGFADPSMRVEQILAGLRTAVDPLSGPNLFAFITLFSVAILLWMRTRKWLSTALLSLALIALSYSDLWHFGNQYNVRTPTVSVEQVPAAVARLGGELQKGRLGVVDRRRHPSLDAELINSNMGLFYGVRDVLVPSPLLIVRNEALLKKVGLDIGERGPQKWDKVAQNPALVSLMGVRWLSSEHPTSMVGLKQHMSTPVFLYENPLAMPSAFLVGCVERTDDPWAALDSLDPRAWAIVEEDVDLPECRTPSVVGSVRPTRVQSDHLVFEVNATQQALMVHTDTHYPGWTAFVDGEEVPLIRADWSFRGVEVPEGLHTVELRYLPMWWSSAAPMSVIAWLFLVGGFISRQRDSVSSDIDRVEEE
jgi:hypothetical protein